MRKNKKIIYLLCAIHCSLCTIHYSHAEEQTPSKNMKEPVFISADRLEFKQKTSPESPPSEGRERGGYIIDGKGNIEIWFRDKVIFGDTVEFNTETESGYIKGNVVMSDPESQIISESAEFNIKTATGILHNTAGVLASKYYFTGERVEKIGTDRYTLFSGTLTTCRGDIPAWRFRVRKSHIHLEHYAYLTGTSLLIKDVPVFYLPYWIVPVKTQRATGLLAPSFGSSNKDGLFINNSFFWAITDHQDATIYLDYLEKKGFREGLEYRYYLSKNSSGNFFGSYLKEKDTEREFYKINFDHNQLFPLGIQGVVKVDILSDANQDKEYEDDTALRTRRYTDSFIRLTKNWPSRSLQILGRKRESVESGYSEIYAQAPEVTFVNQKERIGKLPFFFNIDSSFTSFRNEKDKDKTELERADIHPVITYTFNKYPWLTFTPAVGIRETYYSRGINRRDSFTRDLYDIELKMEGPKFFRIFDPELDSGRSPLKHIIEPRIVYNYIPDIDKEDRREIIQIDNIDAVTSQNIVSYFLTNRMLKKNLGEKSATDEIFRLEISQQYDITEANRSDSISLNPNRPFSDVRFDLDTRIIKPLIFNYDTRFDVYESKINTANLDIGVNYKDIWYLTAERRYTRKPESIFVTGIAGINVTKNLNLQYSSRYDEYNKKFLENDYSTTYSSGCWEFSLDIVDRKYFAESEELNETKFFFLITLKDIVSIGERGNLGLIQRKI
jgi:LPS-assembly protein